MKKTRFCLIFYILFLFISENTYAQASLILKRYEEYLLTKVSINNQEVAESARTLEKNGSWDDIDYLDAEKAGWQPIEHIRRLRQMTIAWVQPTSSYFHQDSLWNRINQSLNYWLKNRFTSTNWWHNEIGTPQSMRDIIILLADTLTTSQFQGALEVFNQYRVGEDYQGANLIWSCDLGIHYAALTGKNSLIHHYAGLIAKEIKISDREGIQPDYSFHQHGPRLQTFHYGASFLKDVSRLAWELHGTPYAFSKDKIELLANFILKGCQWMARGNTTVPGTLDRAVSRPDWLKLVSTGEYARFLVDLVPTHAKAFKDITDRENGKGNPLTGFRYYPYSDFAVHHTKNFSFFLKTISNRTYPTESINNENLKGHLLNAGDAYLINSGSEYYNLMPVWDWEKLPGITNFKGSNRMEQKEFVGSVTDWKSGLSVMDYHLSGELNKSLSTHKFWASHNNLIVCLISKLATENLSKSPFTTLDQCRWTDSVVVNRIDHVLAQGTHKVEQVQWIYHAGFAYLPIKPSSFIIQIDSVTGTWQSINAGESDEEIHEKVFTPTLLHTTNRATGYVLTTCSSPEEAQKLANNPPWDVLRNDEKCQAVAFKDGTTMIGFFEPDTIMFSGKNIEVDTPCALLFKNDQFFASDPTHRGGKLSLKLNGKKYSIELPTDGNTEMIKF